MAGSGQGILREAQQRYLERLLPPRDWLLAEMEQQAAAEGIPISRPDTGRLLEVSARASRARRIVEVGTAIGYGALCLARGALEAQIVSIDHDPVRLARAEDFLRRAGVLSRVQLLEGDALALIPQLGAPIDLAYVDADKLHYRRYLDLLLPQVTVGGTLLFDNLLWKGRIAELPPEDDEEDDEETVEALYRFNNYLLIHPQLQALILPVGDGVGYATKSRQLISELGGPF
jgi:caffeoyl-CoA O-methyltransferase